jgi:glycosyltransferase involved in cell wall biosynthesis
MDSNFQPLVSIVFTSFNHKEYLKQALDSLINQSYTNYELIIVDDCSTDGSQEILLQYESLEKVNLKLQTTNSGSYVNASNYGASLAKGEYLLFAQCDDFADEKQLEILLNAFHTNPTAGVVFSKSNLVNEDGKIFSDDYYGRQKSFKDAVNKNGLIKGSKMKEFLSFSCVIPNLSAALIKHNLFKEVRGLSDQYLVVADWEFWLELSEKTDFYYVSQPLNYFRQHSTTIRSSVKMKIQIIEIFNMFYKHIEKNNLDAKQVYKLKQGAGAIWFSYFIDSKKAWLACFTSVYFKIKKIEQNGLYFLFLGIIKQILEYSYNKVYRDE